MSLHQSSKLLLLHPRLAKLLWFRTSDAFTMHLEPRPLTLSPREKSTPQASPDLKSSLPLQTVRMLSLCPKSL